MNADCKLCVLANWLCMCCSVCQGTNKGGNAKWGTFLFHKLVERIQKFYRCHISMVPVQPNVSLKDVWSFLTKTFFTEGSNIAILA